MGTALLRRHRVESEAGRDLRQCRGDVGQRRGDAFDAPLAELLQRGDRHRHELELGALADVEPSRAGLVLVAVVDQSGEVLRARARDPVLLDRRAVAVLLGDVQVRDADRTQQPLVADGRDEVGPQRGDVERHRADRLTAVDHEPRAEVVRARAHALEVDQGTVGPVHVRHADDRARARRALRARRRSTSGPGSRCTVRISAPRRASPPATCRSPTGTPRPGRARDRPAAARGCGRPPRSRSSSPGPARRRRHRRPRAARTACGDARRRRTSRRR